MNSYPLISICVPVYSVEDYIERCARSLFEQTYAEIDYVFVDDGSPDRSIEILSQVLLDYSEREKAVKIIKHDHNYGVAVARNTAIRHAVGDYILWVDADDSIDPHLVEKLYMKQNETNADIVCYDIKIIFNNHIGFFINGDYHDGRELVKKMLLREAPHQLCGHLIKKSLIVDNDVKCEENINQSEDYQMMIQIAYFANNVATLHEALYYYDRSREDSYSNNTTDESLCQVSKTADIIESFFLNHNEKDLVEKMWQGSVISLCRTKMLYCDLGNKVIYMKICEMIDNTLPKLKQPLAFKYLLLSKVKSYSIFKLLISFKKFKR